jgi:hypothetical protein
MDILPYSIAPDNPLREMTTETRKSQGTGLGSLLEKWEYKWRDLWKSGKMSSERESKIFSPRIRNQGAP